MTVKRAIAKSAALRSSILAVGLAMLTACGGGASQNNQPAEATAPAAPAVPANASPVRAALAEFDGVCGRPMDRAGYSAAATAAGWQAFEATPDSQLGQILAAGRRLVQEQLTQSGRSGDVQAEYSSFRKMTNGRQLLLVMTDMRIPGLGTSLECRLFDFAAPAPTDADIGYWTLAPARHVGEQGMVGWTWRPSFRQGFDHIDVSHFPESSPLRAQVPMLGLSIAAVLPPRQN